MIDQLITFKYAFHVVEVENGCAWMSLKRCGTKVRSHRCLTALDGTSVQEGKNGVWNFSPLELKSYNRIIQHREPKGNFAARFSA